MKIGGYNTALKGHKNGKNWKTDDSRAYDGC